MQFLCTIHVLYAYPPLYCFTGFSFCVPSLSCISSPSLRSTAFPSYLFPSSLLRGWFLFLPHICHVFRKKTPNPKPTVPIKYLSSALFVVLRQIPPCSSPWPWCLENSWQYTLSCWLMQLLCFLIPHIGLLSFVLDLDYKAICPSIYSAELKCSPATTGAIKDNNQINKFWKIRGK